MADNQEPKTKKRAKPAPVEGKRPRGEQTIYTREIADRICRELSQGKTLNQICRQDGMPARPTVVGWAVENVDGFADRYAHARDLMLEHWADELLDVSDDGSNDWMTREGKDGTPSFVVNGEHIQRSRLRVDSRKWLLSKLKPERYGERLHQEVTGKDGKDLMPEVDNRDLARAVLGILRNAKVNEST